MTSKEKPRLRVGCASRELFTQQDTWQGNSYDPATLHKYLYTPSEPVNHIDPSGNSFLSSFGAAFTIQAVLVNASVGAVFGGIDSALGGGSVTSGAATGALAGAVLGPLAWFERLRKPLATTFTALGFFGAASSAQQGNYGQAAFRGLSAALGAYIYFKTAIVPSRVRAPSLADGQVYSGVFYSRTGQIALRTSTTQRPVPSGSVPNRGGHAFIARREFPGANSDELFGITVFAEGNKTIRVEFFSRGVNGQNSNCCNNMVPDVLHQQIIRAVASATGRRSSN